jgi:transcriptional repressor NrdR
MCMNCIYCGGDTSVENSRPQKRSNSVWRRRECKLCGVIFTSNESLDLSGSIIVKSAGLSEPFSRDKLFTSIHDSLKHRKSPVSDATALTDTILRQVLTLVTSPEVQKQQIATICHKTLLNFDKAAATHYAAFHL